MTIPYRIRRNLQRFFTTLLLLVFVAVIVFGAWLLWLNRYVIYTRDGAKFDFDLSYTHPSGELAPPEPTGESVNISYGDSSELIEIPSKELKQMVGFTVTTQMLTENMSEVQQALSELPAGTPVLLDVKNSRGEFLYSSHMGRSPDGFDSAQMDKIIRDLKAKGCYLVARLPAFQDYWYFLEDENGRVPHGLPRYGGNGSLWLDKSNSCYWLNPASAGALNYLVQIVTELRTFGFDEVVFEDFRFPNTESISFEGDQYEALTEAAESLVKACASDTFAVSFVGNNIPLPEGRCRVYVENIPAAEIGEFASALELENPQLQLVFLTDLPDTRYEAYSVLRPLLELPED